MNALLQSLAHQQFQVVTTAQAHECGYSVEEVRHALRSRSWMALRRGRYVQRSVWEGLDDLQQLEARASAVILGFRTSVVAVSHRTAAGIHGLPGGGTKRAIEVTTASGRPRRAQGLVVHAHRLRTEDLTTHGGWLLVTSPARTVADCLRTLPYEDAVVMVDSGLQQGLVTIDSVVAALGDPPRPGARAAQRALAAANSGAESPGETRTRLLLDEAFPGRFESQVEIAGASGKVYRADFADPVLRVAGEYDGRDKYRTREDLVREKIREDDLRLVGWVFFRVTGADVKVPGRVASIAGRAIELARRAA